ncbi:hypothetical protein L0152_10405 [bacterium]|nr:hypothetical protein [bacterium]
MKNSFALVLIFIFAVVISAQTEKKEVIPFQELNSKAQIEGVEVNIKSTGAITLTPAASGLHIYIDAMADLTDFQQKAADIARAGMNKDEECNYSLNFSGAEVIPDRCNEAGGCQFAKMTLTGQYKEKVCILGREKILVSQSFSCIVYVNPEIFQNGLRLRAQVTDVTAGGVMGALMNLEVIRSKVVEMINQRIAEASKSTETTVGLSFPEELKPYKPQLLTATFQKRQQNQLFIRATASASVPETKAQELLNALKTQPNR